MSTKSGWKALPSPQDLPNLLYKFSWSQTGFSLVVTDLLQIWQCEQTRGQILQQVERSKTSIDPNEDASQFDILLSKLDDCLSGHPSSALSFRKDNSGDPGCFWLRAAMSLPAPLRSLEWEFYTTRCSQKVFGQNVVLPVVEAQQRLQAQIGSLKHILEQKDSVISKLLDKVESSGMDLSVIFPGLGRGSKRGVSVQQALKVVPGLSAFHEIDWRESLGENGSSNEEVRGLIENYQSSQKQKAKPDQNSSNETSLDWVEILPEDYTETSLTALNGKVEAELPLESINHDSEETASEDDDFERQQTPPRDPKEMVSSRAKDSPLPSRPENFKATLPVADEITKRVSKIGTLGGKAGKKNPLGSKEKSPSPKQESPSPSNAQYKQQVSSHDTDSDSSSDLDGQLLSRRQISKPSKTASKLGTIGGKKKQPAKSLTPEPVLSEKSMSPSPAKAKQKLGTIGGNKAKPQTASTYPPPSSKTQEESQPSTSQSDSRETVKRVNQKVKVEPVPSEETEEEKAKRKRNELKSQLEKAPVQKKKRKF